MNHAGETSGSCCGAQVETQDARERRSVAPVPQPPAGPARAINDAAEAWGEALDEALAAARANLAQEFDVWRRVSQLAWGARGPVAVADAAEGALSLAIELTGVAGALVLRADATDGRPRVDYRRGDSEGVCRAIEGFADASASLFAPGTAIRVLDLERAAPPDAGLLAAALVKAGAHAVVVVPLSGTSGTVVGALALAAPVLPVLDARHRRLLAMVGRRLADSIERDDIEVRADRDARQVRAIFDSVSDAIVTVDRAGLIRLANPATERVFGHAPDQLIGQSIAVLVAPDEQSLVKRAITRVAGAAVGAAARQPFEVVGVRKGGSSARLEMVINEIAPTGDMSVVIRDISERALAEGRLRQSDRLASIGTLAAGLGHDMNNMLFPMRAHLNAIAADRTGNLPDARAGHVDEILKGVRYLQQLADGLHYLVHDAGHADGGMDGARLAEWWAGTGALLTRALPALTQVHVQIDDRLPRVRASEHALTQAVLNLFVNSGEAMQSRGDGVPGHVTVRASAASDGNAVLLAVSDDGPGMPESVRRRALDPFFTTKTRGMGTGLGLAMVQRVAREAGGSVWIDSAPGCGTTVTLRLPVACDHEGAAGIRVAVSAAEGRAGAFIESAIAGRGFAVVGDAADADAWIADPRVVDPAAAAKWCARRGRSLVLLGQPHRLQTGEWRGLAAGVIEQTKDFDALLVGVDKACAIIMERAGNGRSDDGTGSRADAGEEEGGQRGIGALAGRGARARGR